MKIIFLILISVSTSAISKRKHTKDNIIDQTLDLKDSLTNVSSTYDSSTLLDIDHPYAKRTKVDNQNEDIIKLLSELDYIDFNEDELNKYEPAILNLNENDLKHDHIESTNEDDIYDSDLDVFEGIGFDDMDESSVEDIFDFDKTFIEHLAMNRFEEDNTKDEKKYNTKDEKKDNTKDELEKSTQVTLDATGIDAFRITEQNYTDKSVIDTAQNYTDKSVIDTAQNHTDECVSETAQNHTDGLEGYNEKLYILHNESSAVDMISSETDETEGCMDDISSLYNKESVSSLNVIDKDLIEKYIIDMKKALEDFITSKLRSKPFCAFYIDKINGIKLAYDDLDRNELDRDLYNSIFNPVNDQVYVKRLIEIHNTFNKDQRFDQETLDEFIAKFNSRIYNYKIQKAYHDQILDLKYDLQKRFFYYELVKLNRHVSKVPEILFLCGIFTRNITSSLTFSIHLFNIFLENVEESSRTFNLCMISRILLRLSRGKLNLFPLSDCEVPCHHEHFKTIKFFMSELHLSKRYQVNKKMKNNGYSFYDAIDKPTLKIVFCTYLYQYASFLKFHNVNMEDFMRFKTFVDKVMKAEEVIAGEYLPTYFGEFLGLAKTMKINSSY